MTKPLPKTDAKPQTKPAAKNEKLVIVFGVDGRDGNPKAAWFEMSQAAVARKAAQAAKFGCIEVSSADLIEIAKQLPLGRVYSTGGGAFSVVKPDLYARLLGALGIKRVAQSMEYGLPKTRQDVGRGQLVIAQQDAVSGWFEAIVTERKGDQLELRWRDYPKEMPITRHVSAIALLDADTAL